LLFGGAILECDLCPTFVTDPDVGWILSLEVFSIVADAFYFLASSYSAVGYGDVVLPRAWRSLGPIESVTGVLMCGLSTALLFAIVHLLVQGKITRLQDAP
jgi:hypothetical protein